MSRRSRNTRGPSDSIGPVHRKPEQRSISTLQRRRCAPSRKIAKRLRFAKRSPGCARQVDALGIGIGACDSQNLINEREHAESDTRKFPDQQQEISRTQLGPRSGNFLFMTESLADRIRARLEALGLSAKAASVLAGQNAGFVTDILKGKVKNPRSDTMSKLAGALQCERDWLQYGEGQQVVPKLAGAPVPNARQAEVDYPYRNTMLRDIEVRGTMAGSMAGAFQFEGGVVDYVARPPGLLTAKGIYALYVEGESMSPAHPPGELRFISAFKHPNIGDTVAITAKYTPDGPIETFIKTLVRRTASHVVVEQLNPKATIEFDTKYVVSLHKVLTMNDLFGI